MYKLYINDTIVTFHKIEIENEWIIANDYNRLYRIWREDVERIEEVEE